MKSTRYFAAIIAVVLVVVIILLRRESKVVAGEVLKDDIQSPATADPVKVALGPDTAPPKVDTAKVPDVPRASIGSWDRRKQEMVEHREHYITEAKLRLQSRNGRFFQRLKHTPPQAIARAEDMLAAEEVDTALALMPSDSPDAQGGQLALAKLDAVKSQADAQLRALLAPDDYRALRAHELAAPYESTVEQSTNVIRSQGVGVSDEQQEAILNAYATAAQHAAALAAREVSASQFAAMSAAEREQLRMAQQTRFDGVLADELSKVLPPESLQAFLAAEFKISSGQHP